MSNFMSLPFSHQAIKKVNFKVRKSLLTPMSLEFLQIDLLSFGI